MAILSVHKSEQDKGRPDKGLRALSSLCGRQLASECLHIDEGVVADSIS